MLLACFYGGIWVFNHHNAWLGIAIIAILITCIAQYIINKLQSLIKKNDKDEKDH